MANGVRSHSLRRDQPGGEAAQARTARDRARRLAAGSIASRAPAGAFGEDVGLPGAAARAARNRARLLAEEIAAEQPVEDLQSSTQLPAQEFRDLSVGIYETAKYFLTGGDGGRFPGVPSGTLKELTDSGRWCDMAAMVRRGCPAWNEGPILCPTTFVDGLENPESSAVASPPPVWIEPRGREDGRWDAEGRRTHLFVLPSSAPDAPLWKYLELIVCVDTPRVGELPGRVLVEPIAATPEWRIGCDDVHTLRSGEQCCAGNKTVTLEQRRPRGLRIEASEVARSGGQEEIGAAVVNAGTRGNFILKPPEGAYGVELVLTPVAGWNGRPEQRQEDRPLHGPPSYTFRLKLAGGGLLREDYRHPTDEIEPNGARANVTTIARQAQFEHVVAWLAERGGVSPESPVVPPFC